MNNAVPAGRELVGQVCPACRLPIREGAPVVVCQACGSPHHSLCWQRSGRCAAQGCAARTDSTIMQPSASPSPSACPKCGYIFAPLEKTCRRCAAGFGAPVSRTQGDYQPRRKSSWPILAALLVVLAVVAGVVCVQTGIGRGGINLEYKFTQGQEIKYAMAMDMNMDMPQSPMGGGPMNIKGASLYVLKTVSVDKDGSATIECATKNMRITAPFIPGGGDVPVPDQTQTVKMTRTGGTEKPKTDDSASFLSFGSSQNGLGGYSPFDTGALLPGHPVNVGDTWDETTTLPSGGKMKIKSKLVSATEMVGTIKTCRIEQQYDADLISPTAKVQRGLLGGGGGEGATMTGSGVFHFSPEQGQVVDADLKLNLAVKPAGSQAKGTKIDIGVRMNLAK